MATAIAATREPIMMKNLTIAFGLAAALLGQPAAAAPAQAQLTALMDNYIAQDSREWFFHSYRAGDVVDARLTQLGADGRSFTARANYIFNGNQRGWVEAVVSNGQLQCLRFWDSGRCRPMRQAGWRDGALVTGVIAAVGVAVVANAASSSNGSSNQSAGSRWASSGSYTSTPRYEYHVIQQPRPADPPPAPPVQPIAPLYGCAAPPCW
jgi:hypothetical protein